MRLLLFAAIAMWIGLLPVAPAQARTGSSGPCDDEDKQVNLNTAAAECTKEGRSALPTGQSDVTTELSALCGAGNSVLCASDCVTDDGEEGTRYLVYVDDELVGPTCLAPNDGNTPDVTPDRVLRAFQRLDWPQSELIVQPPDGQTLVNFDTNFLTDNTGTTRQQVTLLGQQITIEAWPESYTWEFGDGETLTTESAGKRYPELEITHRYLQKETYAPSVATTYAGRFRVGGGAWVDIPGTHTVPGDAVDLEVVEASPILVAPDGG